MKHPKLPTMFVGEISNSSLNPRHLVPTYVRVLSFAWPEHPLVKEYNELGNALGVLANWTRTQATDIADQLGVWETDDMGDLQEGLFDALNSVAPEGTSFGPAEGDHASFGFWPTEEDEEPNA